MGRRSSSPSAGPIAAVEAVIRPEAMAMKSGAARAAALSCVLLAAACLPAPAGAQGEPKANVSPPAEAYAVSPGGVDMRSGRYAY
ncbi:MAG: hypothetical protein QOH47_2573, partial [Sphingomonadales bacterium]|nr:hypothetical protein [Sphingomonadales bacterium]